MLITVQKFIDDNFEDGSKPHKSTVYRWIRRGEIAGMRIGDSYYVESEQSAKKAASFAFLAKTQPD